MCSATALVVTWEDWCRLTLSRYQPAGRQGGLFVLLKCQFTSLLSSNKGKPKQNDLGYNFHLRLWLASQAHRKFHIPSHPTILWTNNLPKPRSKLEWRPQESNNKINKKQIFTRTPTLPKLGLCLNIYRQQTAITAAGSLKTPPNMPHPRLFINIIILCHWVVKCKLNGNYYRLVEGSVANVWDELNVSRFYSPSEVKYLGDIFTMRV